MTQKAHVMHGRDHLPTGADPIPGILGATDSGADYASLVLATSSLVGYWRMGDTASPLLDTYGGPDPQDLVGGGALGTFDVTGALPALYDDGAYNFGYNQSSLSPPGGTGAPAWSATDTTTPKFAFSGTASFTVEAWIKPTSGWSMPSGGWGHIAGPSTTSGLSSPAEFTGWGLILWNDRTVELRRADTAPSNTGVRSGAITADAWHHVVGTYDGTTLRLYVDGTLVVSAASATSVTNVTTFRVGWSQSNQSGSTQTRFFYGAIDELAIYSAALSTSEVAAHYASGIGAGSSTILTPSATVAGQVLTSVGDTTTEWAYPTIEVQF